VLRFAPARARVTKGDGAFCKRFIVRRPTNNTNHRALPTNFMQNDGDQLRYKFWSLSQKQISLAKWETTTVRKEYTGAKNLQVFGCTAKPIKIIGENLYKEHMPTHKNI
jgi:hypothetical protein